MPVTCCVPCCTTGYASNKAKIPTFSTQDTSLMSKWSAAIPRQNYKVTGKSRVCALHFEEEDIVKGTYVTIHGEKVFTPFDRWRLRPLAVPSIFPGCPPHLSKPKKASRPGPKERIQLTENYSRKRKKIATEENADSLAEPLLLEDQNEGASYVQETEENQFNLRLHLNDLQLPTKWCILHEKDTDECKMIKVVQAPTKEEFVDRSILISGSHLICQDFTCEVVKRFSKEVGSITEANSIVKSFDEVELCAGVKEKQLLVMSKCKEGKRYTSCWRSTNCKQVVVTVNASGLCDTCIVFQRTLQRRHLQSEERKKKTRINKGRNVKNLNQRVKRFHDKILQLKSELTTLRKNALVTDEAGFNNYIRTSSREV